VVPTGDWGLTGAERRRTLMRTTAPPVLVTVLLGVAWYLMVVGHVIAGSTVLLVMAVGSVLWRRWQSKGGGTDPGCNDSYREQLVGAVCFYGLLIFLVVLAILEQGAGRAGAVIGAVFAGLSAIWLTYSGVRARARRADSGV